MSQDNIDLALTIIAVATLSFSGWLIFSGINGLFPQIETLQPVVRIAIGFVGIFSLVKLGIRKLQ